MSSAEFFARDKAGQWTEPLHTEPAIRVSRGVTRRVARSVRRQRVIHEVKRQAKYKLGRRWVRTAVRISYVESRHNPKAVGPRTRHGRARGVMQVIPKSARKLGFDPRRLNELRYGVAAGIAHMRMCIAYGVRTDAEMAACHVAGVYGWKARLRRRAQLYKHKYVRLVMNAPAH